MTLELVPTSGRPLVWGDILDKDMIFELAMGGLWPEAWSFWTYDCPYDKQPGLRELTQAWLEALAQPRTLHNWTWSTLGHGETMCRNCFITNREAAVLGLTNHCDSAPPNHLI